MWYNSFTSTCCNETIKPKWQEGQIIKPKWQEGQIIKLKVARGADHQAKVARGADHQAKVARGADFIVTSVSRCLAHPLFSWWASAKNHCMHSLHVFTLPSLPSACVHTIITTICMCSHHHHYHLHVFTPSSLLSALALHLHYLHVASPV